MMHSRNNMFITLIYKQNNKHNYCLINSMSINKNNLLSRSINPFNVSLCFLNLLSIKLLKKKNFWLESIIMASNFRVKKHICLVLLLSLVVLYL